MDGTDHAGPEQRLREAEERIRDLEASIAAQVHERDVAGEALRRSEQELREAQRVGRLGSWDWDAKSDTITWSPEYRRIVGYHPTAPPPGYDEHLRFYTPESIARLDAAVKRNMTTGEPYELDLEFANPEAACRWITARSETKRDAQGNISGLRGTAQDITERKRAEQALRDSEERYRMVVEHASDGIFIFDERATCLDVNPSGCRMLGCSRDELLGTSLTAFIAPASAPPEPPRIAEVRAGASLLSERAVRRKDGSTFAAELSSTQLHAGRFIASVRDITHRKRAQDEATRLQAELERRVAERTAELEAANRELDAFAYSVSHDLRAPVRHVSAFMAMLHERVAGSLDDQSTHYLEVIEAAARSMGAMIDDLLAFSRMGRAELVRGAVDLGRLVRAAVDELAADADGRDIEWLIGGLPSVHGDASMLRLAFSNLLANSLKFTRARPRARIEVVCADANADHEVVVSVRDNGVGFDMAYVHKLFRVFQRLHRVEDFEGTGIGLANVRRIVERHGGRVWAEGALGAGATFYVALPRG